MPNHLNLFVPEWHGYGVDNSPQLGAHRLRSELFPDRSFCEVAVLEEGCKKFDHSIACFETVSTNMRLIRKAIQSSSPDSIFSIGGTCGIEVGPVTWLNQQVDGDLAVVWMDAHADLNTPDSSPSGHFHGMPVRTILGEGNDELCNQAFSKLSSNQIFQVGIRDLDPPETEFIKSQNISTYPVNVDPNAIIGDIARLGMTNVYIHFDLDVLEPNQFDDMIFHVPEGMGLDDSLEIVRSLSERYNVIGSSLLEYVPRSNSNFDYLRQLSELLQANYPVA